VAPQLPFTVKRIDHVVLRVRNPRTSLAFYRDILGCNVVRERPDLGLIHIRAGVSMIDLVDVDGELGRRGGAAPGQDARNVDHVCLRVEPFDETSLREHLVARGVFPIGPVSRNFGAEGDGLSIYIRDPDGNLVELKGPADSAAAADSGS
jgi:glyoxylase I family protein